MHIKLLIPIVMITMPLIGCTFNKTPEQKSLGSDVDSNGCIASAGYLWCKRTNQCERPWEIAEQEGFSHTEDFQQYCENARKESP